MRTLDALQTLYAAIVRRVCSKLIMLGNFMPNVELKTNGHICSSVRSTQDADSIYVTLHHTKA